MDGSKGNYFPVSGGFFLLGVFLARAIEGAAFLDRFRASGAGEALIYKEGRG